jgi:hypothetical protein
MIVGWSTALPVINESLGQLPKKLAAGPLLVGGNGGDVARNRRATSYLARSHNYPTLFRRTAYYVDIILKGSSVQEKLQLALELKRAMGRIAFLGNAAPRRFYGRRPRIGYASPPLTTDAPS